MGSARYTQRLRWLAASATLASLVVPALGASAASTVAKGTTWTARPTSSRLGAAAMAQVIVQAKAGKVSAAAARVTELGGSVEKSLPFVNGFSAVVPAGALGALRADAAVKAVTENSKVTFASNIYEDTTIASSYTKVTGAPAAWASGNLGEGVGVAVIDTGISPQNDFSGRLVHGPDLSGEGTIVDSYGHGTVMGGIVGGSGADSMNNNNGAYVGIAPKSTLVAVKVAGRNGASDVSTMLQAMHWVSAYKDQFNIRVLNLSWGTSSTADPATDPLNYAVQRLWQQGIVVVVSAGNSGPNAGTIMKPADDPVAITVGAFNDGGNTSTSDDSIPSWSSRGPTAHGLVKPDVVASGRTLVTTRSFGSKVEQENPKALVSPSYIKGSGTSEAAAVVSGVAALLLKAHPEWTPDQVKYALRSTANPISNVGQYSQGKGRVGYAAAVNANVSAAPVQATPATGRGPIEGSRGSLHVWADCEQNGTYVYIQGEIDSWCRPWDGALWSGATWNGDVWTGAIWTGSMWTGAGWNGAGWNGAGWNGAGWNGAGWNGALWNGAGWNEGTWTSAEYDDALLSDSLLDSGDLFLTAFYGGRPKYGHHVVGEKSEPRGAARATGDDN